MYCQKPGLWLADSAGQQIRKCLCFGGKLLEFISQSQIKGDYNFNEYVATKNHKHESLNAVSQPLSKSFPHETN